MKEKRVIVGLGRTYTTRVQEETTLSLRLNSFSRRFILRGSSAATFPERILRHFPRGACAKSELFL